MSWTSKAKESMFARDNNGNLLVRDAVIMQGRNANGNWSNFSGRKTKVNPNGGKRTFNIVLPEDVALELRDEGWNIKMMQPRDDQEDILYFTEIVLNMEKKVEPDVYLCTEWAGKKKKTRLHGDDVGQLDDIRFAHADVNIYPHMHDKGIKGHCNQLVVIQAKNDLFDGRYDEYEEDRGE